MRLFTTSPMLTTRDQLTVVDHRDVPDAVLGHLGHQLVDVVAGLAGLHDGGHDLSTGGVEDRVVAVELAYDVALADDAVDRGAVAADDHGADVVLGQERQQVAHRGVRGDRDDARWLDLPLITSLIFMARPLRER